MVAFLAWALAAASAQYPNTAHVRLHPQAGVLPPRVRSAVQAQDWPGAARCLAEAVEADPNGLVPLGENRYVSAAEYQRRAIASWPDEGRAAVRALTDPAARNWLSAARDRQDPAPLRTLLARAPFSSVAEEALLLLGSLALHAGDVDEAFRALARWYDEYREGPRALYGISRFAEACRAAGRLDRLRELAACRLPEGEVLCGGRALPLGALLGEWLRTAAASPPPAARHEWPQYGGAPDGAPPAPDPPEAPGLQWSIALQGYPYEETGGRSAYNPYADPPRRERARVVRWFPAAAEGLVVVQDETSARAFALYGRSAREFWSFVLPLPAGGTLSEEERTVHAPTVRDGRVYAALLTAVGQHVRQEGWIPITYPLPHRALFCLDAVTGREVWRTGGAIGTGRLPEALSFALGPSVVGDDVYAGAVVQEHATDPFRHYVVCLDAATGALRWATFIASGSTEQNLFGNSSRESAGSRVAVSGDFLLYVTNVGALAALDRHSGEIRWLFRYEQWRMSPPPQLHPNPLPLCWWNNPPILAEGRAVVTPVDSPFLYVLDAAGGRPLWTLSHHEAGARYVYGLLGDLLVLGGSDVRGYRIGDASRAWVYTPEGTVACGLGAAGPGTIYVPTLQGVDLVDARTLERRARVRLDGLGEAGGVVIALGEAILAVHRSGLHALSNPRRIEADVAAALSTRDLPPERLYDAALKSRQVRDAATARELFTRVAQADPGGPLGRRASHQLGVLERDEADRAIARGDWRTALERLRAALRWADDAPGRLLLAHALLQNGRPAEAVELFQQLLKEGGPVREEARKFILQAVRAHGASLYAPYEARAAAARAAAEVHRDPERLRQLVLEFPHSVAAREALEGAIRRAARQEDLSRAMALLRLYLREIPEAPSMPQLLADAAVELERRSLAGAAEFVLRTLAQRAPEAPIQAEDGAARAGPWAQARLARPPYAEAAGPARDAIRLEPAGRVELAGGETAGAVLSPLGRPSASLASIALLAGGRALHGLDTSVPELRWTTPLAAPPQWAALVDDRAVVGTARAIHAVSLRDGRVLWTHEPGGWSQRAVVGSLVVGLAPGGGETRESALVALDAFTGEKVWETRPGEGPVLGLAALERSHVAVLLASRPAQVQIVDAFTGRPVGGPALPRADATPRLYASEGGVVVVVPMEGALALSPAPARRAYRWRQPSVAQPGESGALIAMGRDFLVQVSERPGSRARFAAVGLRSGRLEADEVIPAPGRVAAAAVGEEWSVVAFEAGAGVRLTAMGNVRGPALWARELPREEELLAPPRFAGDAVVVLSGRAARADRVEFRMRAWNRAGEPVLDYAPDGPAGGFPSAAAAGGAWVLSVGGRVEVWR